MSLTQNVQPVNRKGGGGGGGGEEQPIDGNQISAKPETFIEIFRTRVLCIRLFVMCSAWWVHISVNIYVFFEKSILSRKMEKITDR